jgi:hypothetical protein
MRRRKQKIRQGLAIDFDLLDADMLRCYIPLTISWMDGPRPRLVWTEFADDDGWTPGKDPVCQLMMRTLDDERELAEGRRLIRLKRYKSFSCLADLAARKKEKGEFIIRMPPNFGRPNYVADLDEARLPPGFGDADTVGLEPEAVGVQWASDFSDARRFTHAEAIRLTVRIMEALGCDIPHDMFYFEPLRADVAEELHLRAMRRPRRSEALYAMLNDLSREP